MLKPLLSSLSVFALLSLVACTAETDVTRSEVTPQGEWPSLAQRLECLPRQASIVAAHRGTSKGKGLTENSLESLRTLYRAGVRLAEIDVAQLYSGEHILFHDGVWDEKSTGQGAVASSNWGEVQDYLLRDTEGGVSSYRAALLTDILTYARGRLHLEIDFKSSANYAEVIEIIRAQDMQDDVVLISYSTGQARKLARLAPDMFISVSVKKPSDIKNYEAVGVSPRKMMAWVGSGENIELLRFLETANIPILSRNRRRNISPRTHIMVTDYALNNQIFEGAIGLKKAEQPVYKACLSEGRSP